MIEIVIRNSGECPIYEQIVRQIKAQIIRGSLLPAPFSPTRPRMHPSGRERLIFSSEKPG